MQFKTTNLNCADSFYFNVPLES